MAEPFGVNKYSYESYASNGRPTAPSPRTSAAPSKTSRGGSRSAPKPSPKRQGWDPEHVWLGWGPDGRIVGTRNVGSSAAADRRTEAAAKKRAKNNGGDKYFKGTSVADAEIYVLKDPERLAELTNKVSAILGAPATTAEVLAVWKKAVTVANTFWRASEGGTKFQPKTPFDLIEEEVRAAEIKNGPSLAGKSITEKQKTITKLSDGQLWSYIDTAARQALGRAPTSSEIREFASRANSIAANNPMIESTTVKYGPDGKPLPNSTRRVEQGASDADYRMAAEKMANADPEAGAYQAATTYYNAFLKAIGTPV